MGLWLIVGGLVLAYPVYLFYFYFIKDVMNRIQYFESLKVYWITKNTAGRHVPLVIFPSVMQQTQPPFWYGTGIEFRLFKWTFQIGKLQGKGGSPITIEDLPDVTVPEIREWERPE